MCRTTEPILIAKAHFAIIASKITLNEVQTIRTFSDGRFIYRWLYWLGMCASKYNFRRQPLQDVIRIVCRHGQKPLSGNYYIRILDNLIGQPEHRLTSTVSLTNKCVTDKRILLVNRWTQRDGSWNKMVIKCNITMSPNKKTWSYSGIRMMFYL